MKALQSTTSRPICAMLPSPHSAKVEAVCEEHGPYTATLYVLDIQGDGTKPFRKTSPCPTCTEKARAMREARQRAAQAEERKRKIEGLTNRSGIPPRFTDRTFDNYTATEKQQRLTLSVCRAYASAWTEKRKQGASLILTGSPGTGKTHLACAIGNAVMAQHLDAVLFCPISTMLGAIKKTYSKDAQEHERDVIAQFSRVDLLILDEVGVQVNSDHEKLLMFEVLNERYQSMRPTILLSNLSVDELEKILGQRIMDRYRECGSVLAFDWQSHRGKKTEVA